MSRRHKLQEDNEAGHTADEALAVEHPDGEPAENGARRKRKGNVRWQLIGVLPDGRTRIIGEDRTRGRCRKRWGLIGVMAQDTYTEIYAQRCVRLSIQEMMTVTQARSKKAG